MAKSKYIAILISAIVTLGLSTNLGSETDNNVIPNARPVSIWSSNFDIKRNTKTHSKPNLYGKTEQRFENVISQRTVYHNLQKYVRRNKNLNTNADVFQNTYLGVQYLGTMELNITRDRQWDFQTNHRNEDWGGKIKQDKKNIYVNENHKVQHKNSALQYKNIYSGLDTVRNYHELIGIPLAEEIKRVEKKFERKFQDNNLVRISGGNNAELGHFPFIVSILEYI